MTVCPTCSHLSRSQCERVLFGCLLVALIIGIFSIKLWVVSVEERLAENLAIHWTGVDTDKSQINVLYNHENRIRRVEYNAIAVWDHHAPCDGWPTTQQIARGRDDE